MVVGVSVSSLNPDQANLLGGRFDSSIQQAWNLARL
jgi:hypothetical protein